MPLIAQKTLWPEQKEMALLACSGGADSVALLLLALEAGWQKHLQVVHCHHGLRPEADAEAEFVSQLCQTHQLPLHLCHFQLNKESNNLQEIARQARHRAFAQIAQKTQSKLVFLAHHQDDQAETVLWHLLRGSGSKGLSAMSLNSPLPSPLPLANKSSSHKSNLNQLNIHRPLLAISRQEIEAYLNAQKQTWCNDASNQSLTYQRNRLRLQALPALAKLTGREITAPLARSANILGAEDEFLNQLSQQELSKLQDPEQNSLSCKGLLTLPLAMQRRVLQDWLQSQDFTPRFEQIEDLRKLALALYTPGGSPARLQLNKHREVRRQNAQLLLKNFTTLERHDI